MGLVPGTGQEGSVRTVLPPHPHSCSTHAYLLEWSDMGVSSRRPERPVPLVNVGARVALGCSRAAPPLVGALLKARRAT